MRYIATARRAQHGPTSRAQLTRYRTCAAADASWQTELF